MRFPVVLFDLDGTLIDSGPIILASMQHATRTVLGRDIAYVECSGAEPVRKGLRQPRRVRLLSYEPPATGLRNREVGQRVAPRARCR